MGKESFYSWQGVNINGETQKGELKALNKQQVVSNCQKNGVVVTKISRVYDFSFFNLHRLKAADIHFFIVQLKTMLESGLPLLDSLAMLADVSENRQLKGIIRELMLKMRAGETFSQALSHYPQYFSSLFISLVEVGEQTGRLAETLEQLLSYQQIEILLKQKVKKALTYPAVVFFATTLIAGGLLIFVVPKFIHIFSSMNANLPALTLYIVHLSDWFSQYWRALFIILSCALFIIKLLKTHSRYCQIFGARIVLAIPVVGSIVHQALIIRYCKTLMTLLLAGISITQACRRAAQVTDNAYFIYALRHVSQQIASGNSLSYVLMNINLIPHLMCQMVKVGEESGEITHMLEHVSQHYLSVLTSSVEQLGQMLEPIFLFILGGLVGILVIALYLPIFDLMTVMR